MNNKPILDSEKSQLLDAAIEWHIRVSDSGATTGDWSAFTEWLEQDSAHLIAYDHVSSLDAGLVTLRGNPANDVVSVEPSAARKWAHWPAVTGLVASLFLAIVVWTNLENPSFQIIETAPGERRIIALGPETSIEMNGNTIIATDPDNPRFARLDKGEAIFFVRHDAENPFVVESGRYLLRDEGTVFNVKNTGQLFNVAVSEGVVRFNPDNEAMVIMAGNSLTVKDSGQAQLGTIDPLNVAGWREGRLYYDDASLSLIASDLKQLQAMNIAIDQNISDRRFTGVIIVDEGSEQMIETLEQLLGVQVQETKEGWLFTA